jgi:precorrin-6B methylase 2
MAQNTALQMMQMLTGGIVAQSISTAAELAIADHLASGGKSTAELAALAGADEEKLHRLLRFLANLEIFELDEAGAWQLTELAGLLLSNTPHSMRAGARMFGRIAHAFPHMTENVRTGQCAYSLAFGKPIFEDLTTKPEDAAIFDAAMNSFHGGETLAVLNAYNYDGISVLADVGCGSGMVLKETLKRYPSMRGVFFDQAHVLERTKGNIEAAGLSDRSEFHNGNFFESIPPGADAYSMRHIIHDWNDALCSQILSNIRKVIPPHGRVLIIEAVIPEGNDPSLSKLFDMIMMVCPDGMERTENHYRTLLAANGFALHSVTPTLSPVSVIDARPV